MEAQCKTCGIAVAITEVRSSGYSFEMKPGQSLKELCPVLIAQKSGGETVAEAATCPNLQEAIEAKITSP